MKEKWDIKKTLVHYGNGTKLIVTAGIHLAPCTPAWSITADEYDLNGLDEPTCCGCMHDEILKHFPELKPIVDLHLSSPDGTPMHALENALYYYDQKHWATLYNHLRWSDSNIELIRKEFNFKGKSLIQFLNMERESNPETGLRSGMEKLIERIFNPIWKKEAKFGRKLLEQIPDNADEESPFSKKVREFGIKSTNTYEGMVDNTNHYKVRFRWGKRSMTVPFFCGSAYGEVTTPDVLSCCIRNAQDVIDADFEEFCSNVGYDTDSLQAEKIYKESVKLSKKLRKFLGNYSSEFGL